MLCSASSESKWRTEKDTDKAQWQGNGTTGEAKGWEPQGAKKYLVFCIIQIRELSHRGGKNVRKIRIGTD